MQFFQSVFIMIALCLTICLASPVFFLLLILAEGWIIILRDWPFVKYATIQLEKVFILFRWLSNEEHHQPFHRKRIHCRSLHINIVDTAFVYLIFLKKAGKLLIAKSFKVLFVIIKVKVCNQISALQIV